WLTQFAMREVKRLGSGLGRRTVRTKYGFEMNVDVADFFGQRVYATGNWEDATSAVAAALIEPGAVVIDIGANVGWFTLLAASRVGVNGKVYAFEPVPPVRAQLLDNVRRNRMKQVEGSL